MSLRFGKSISKLSSFSAYGRADSHLVTKTHVGGIVTLGGVFLALILFCSEFGNFVTLRRTTRLGVDTARDRLLRINLDLSFHALPCQALSLDAVDVSGEQGGDISLAKNGQLHKIRLDPTGQRLTVAEYVSPRHWGFTLHKPRAEITALNKAFEDKEGCRVEGWLDVQRVAGNFHVAVHMEDYVMLDRTQRALALALRNQRGDHPLQPLESDDGGLNMTHTIHKLQFGTPVKQLTHPLDGVTRIVTREQGIFKYFLKVVPTTFKRGYGRMVQSNQFSVTEYDAAQPQGGMQMPAVWFLYDLSPISVDIVESHPSLLHFLTRMCAVVGGGFTVTGLVDRLVHAVVVKVTGSKSSQ